MDNNREPWDIWFLKLAQVIATRSRDPSTKVGAVIVRPNRTIASLGFNGFPRGMSDAQELYDNREEKYSRVIHAEMNALLHCCETVKDYMLYCTMIPCDRCLVHLAQAGITRFIAPQPSLEALQRWGASFAKTRAYAAEMGLELVEVNQSDMLSD